MNPADQPNARRWGGTGFFDLPVVHAEQDGQSVMVTAWELSDEEVAQVQQTGLIWLSIMGQVHPPVWLTTANPFEGV